MAGKPDTRELAQQHNPLEYLTSRYWSPSALFVIDLVVVLTGLGFVTAAVNAIIRILFAMGRESVFPRSLPAFPAAIPPSWPSAVSPLALMLGLPLTYTHGGARAFGYLAGGPGFRWCSSTSP
jgi:L-asparagine transporter-like permease